MQPSSKHSANAVRAILDGSRRALFCGTCDCFTAFEETGENGLDALALVEVAGEGRTLSSTSDPEWRIAGKASVVDAERCCRSLYKEFRRYLRQQKNREPLKYRLDDEERFQTSSLSPYSKECCIFGPSIRGCFHAYTA